MGMYMEEKLRPEGADEGTVKRGKS